MLRDEQVEPAPGVAGSSGEYLSSRGILRHDECILAGITANRMCADQDVLELFERIPRV